jgi:AcrR family transcriptional regulator
MQPVFTLEALGLSEGGRLREGLERLAAGGELKAKLLLVALTHFAARGYDGVQVREVAEEAGVSKPTLYYHFESKEGLFRQLCLVALAFMERRVQLMVAPLLEPVPQGTAVREACGKLARAYLDLLQEVPEFTGFILRSIAVPAPDSGFRDLMPLVERGLSPLGLFIHRVFGVDLDRARMEVLLFTAHFGALVEEQLRNPEYRVDERQLEWAVDRWLLGIQGWAPREGGKGR